MTGDDQGGSGRAERERARFDQGLDNRYRRHLARSMHHFEMHRIRKGAAIVKAFEAPRVLELGAFNWYAYIEFGGCEAPDLTCVNVSEAELRKGMALARTTRHKPVFRRMDAHALEFEDASFDVVFGAAMLHHLDMDRALAEIDRVLRPGGRFFFHEPMDINPVARLVRALTPRARTADERPFRMRDLRLLQERFDCRFDFTEFLTVPVGALASAAGLPGDGALMKGVYRIDRGLAAVPGLRLLSRHVFVTGRKKAAKGGRPARPPQAGAGGP